MKWPDDVTTNQWNDQLKNLLVGRLIGWSKWPNDVMARLCHEQLIKCPVNEIFFIGNYTWIQRTPLVI